MTDMGECVLELNALEVSCIIGDLPWERETEQLLKVDIELGISGAVFISDELSDTVDYARLAGIVSERLKTAKCRMIERAARVVADACLEEAGVSFARVKVTKFGAIEHLKSASVAVTLFKKQKEMIQ